MTTEEELASMRRSIRILTVLVTVLAASLVAIVATAWRGFDEVRARSFTLLDSSGQPAAVLKNGEGGPALTLLEPGGVVILGDVKGDIGLGVASTNHEHIMHLLLGRDGFPSLSLSSPGADLSVGVAGRRPAIIFKTNAKMRLAITDEALRAFDDAGASVDLLPPMKAAVEGRP